MEYLNNKCLSSYRYHIKTVLLLLYVTHTGMYLEVP